MAKSPILGGFSTQISPNAADNTTINLNVEVIETKDSKVPGFLRGASGLDLLNSVGSFVLTGGRITSGGGSGYAAGEIITLIADNGEQLVSAVLLVTSVNAGAVTSFTIMDPGLFRVEPTEFTQQHSSGAGIGFSLADPTYDTKGPVRGVKPLNDVLYVVAGAEVWSLSANGVKTHVGDIGDETTPVSMFQNTRQLMIVDGVGAWLVPGGLPLTGGVINNPGGLYAVNDTIVLKAATGVQNAFPELTITAVSDHPVVVFSLSGGGSGYTSATNVATTNIQPQPGNGTGLTINITSVSGGHITGSAVSSGGTGYATGDTGAILGGAGDAWYRVTGQTAGVVTSFILLNVGTSYSVSGAAATHAEPAISVNVGAGFTVDTTAAGAITVATTNSGGHGYVVGAAGFITGGGGDATYLVNAVGPTGSVTAFKITQPGAIVDPALSFTQRSTSGSGSGFILTSPTYGAFVGLVPIIMPFPNPIVGGISDGFGLLVFLNSQFLAASDEEDLSTWRPLSFGVANQSPDNCISLAVLHDEVYLPKENNTEIWNDQGLANFPFGPLSSNHIEFGCVAPFSVAEVDQELIWLSRNDQGEGIVIRVSGYSAEPVSTQALVTEFQTYPNLADAIAYGRQEGQHVYYVITFPEANKTWQFDKTASKLVGYPIWTELAALDKGELNRHWGNCFTPFRTSGQPSTTTTSYQPQSVIITTPTVLSTIGALEGLPSDVSSAVFSIWLDMPDSDPSGIFWSNQTDDTLGSPNPGLQIRIQNDTQGTPQIEVHAFDASSVAIVDATYDFTNWADWVNMLISIDTATQQLQVYANTLVSGSLVETSLTPASITWTSTNPMHFAASQSWHVVDVS